MIPTVAHVANPSLNRWQDILDDLRTAGLDFESVEASQWVEAMAKSEGDEVTNPSKKMLSMWRSAVSISLEPARSPEFALIVFFPCGHSMRAMMVTSLLPPSPRRKRRDYPKAWQSAGRYRRTLLPRCWPVGGNQDSYPSDRNRCVISERQGFNTKDGNYRWEWWHTAYIRGMCTTEDGSVKRNV